MGKHIMPARARALDCACCGGDAGRWQQWFNQDTGFGLCVRCAEWVHGRGMAPDAIVSTYGKPGIHREAASFEREV